MQLAILCLLAMNGIVANTNNDSCRSVSCRKHLGVYLLYRDISVPDVNEYEVVTFHADDTFSLINSLQDGTIFPEFGSYSNGEGVWKCADDNRITVTALLFAYPKGAIPRSLIKVTYSYQFYDNDRVSASAIVNLYNQSSTENQDQSKWIQFPGTFTGNFNGYKLFDICDVSGSGAISHPHLHFSSFFLARDWSSLFSLLFSLWTCVVSC